MPNSPLLPNKRVNFNEIMQAIEDQLIADAVIDPTLIVWGRPDAGPPYVDPFTLFMFALPGQHDGRDGGSGQLMMRRNVDIVHRTGITGPDRSKDGPDYVKRDPAFIQAEIKAFYAAEYALADNVINSVGFDGFWPEDQFGNLLTIEPIKLVSDRPPGREAKKNILEEYVCTLSCLYFPDVDPNKGIQPIT